MKNWYAFMRPVREREVCDLLKKKLKALGASEIIEDNNGSVEGGTAAT